MTQIYHDELQHQTTHEIKKILASLDGSIENITPLIGVCMSLCDRIASLEEQVQKIQPGETRKGKIVQLNTEEQTITLREQIREASRLAEKQDTSGDFNSMSWLDLELENNPKSFDDFFDRAWDELPETEQAQRSIAIRSVL